MLSKDYFVGGKKKILILFSSCFSLHVNKMQLIEISIEHRTEEDHRRSTRP